MVYLQSGFNDVSLHLIEDTLSVQGVVQKLTMSEFGRASGCSAYLKGV